jgi:hypothetical protein
MARRTGTKQAETERAVAPKRAQTAKNGVPGSKRPLKTPATKPRPAGPQKPATTQPLSALAQKPAATKHPVTTKQPVATKQPAAPKQPAAMKQPAATKRPAAPRLAPPPGSAALPPEPTRAATPTKEKPFLGQRFAFFGEFSVWPGYHAASPSGLAQRLGAKLTDSVDADTVVFGDRRGAGRAEAKKQLERLVKKPRGPLPRVLDEASYRELVRLDLRGKRFAFIGGFDCSPGGFDDGLLPTMVKAADALVTTEIDASLDYLVVGNRRGPSKVAVQNKVKALNERGASVAVLDETTFLELARVDTPRSAGGELDFAGFLSQLYGHVDEGKLGRALDMLRGDRFKLYTHLDEARLVGVVRSQSGSGSVYASWLTPAGAYGCSQPELTDCMGLQGSPCKHLLVLVVGLARTGALPLAQALEWVRAASTRPPRADRDLAAQTFVQYKGAEAGQLDWRPTETIPEDFYAL